jgi:hypothetical protein
VNRLVLGVSFLLMAACGGTGSVATSSAGTRSSAASASLQQLSQQFAALNIAANTALVGASQQLQIAATIDQAKAAITTALNAYLAFDNGLQHLSLPSSMSADVTSQLHADSLVEADYQNAESDSSLGQMQSTLATVAQDSNAAGAATIILRRDLGLPPTS